uniref:RRM domain-containing protein n=1 Tax=Lactuca sativa TaxID=4236 RepID=A0A9R1UQS4_LACSA|nr:hypothetical protein LSAT_V11C800440610 [Lactuca sativa]
MQRNSVAVRQLIHYKGQPDPLKGDALNKSKPTPQEGLTQRIQGFGNTKFDVPSDDKKSFLSDMVGIGSATIKQGLNSLSQAPTHNKNDTGTYGGPNLRRSLTNESSYSDSKELSSQAALSSSHIDTENGNASSSYSNEKSREERLLETIVTSGGVRLQPTCDVIQVFLMEASKLNAVALSHALKAKLQSHMWQAFNWCNLDERVNILIQAGRVVDLHIPQDKETDKPKGFVFAEYEKEEIVDYVVRLFTGLVTLYNKILRFRVTYLTFQFKLNE